MTTENSTPISIQQVAELSERIIQEVEKAVVGKYEVLQMMMAAFLSSGGHILLEDYPGLAKTLIANSFSMALGMQFKRIQFTPDLLPGDITGGYVFESEKNRFMLRKGPIFTNILLADEINRASPKTQSALLEAMQEYQVTLEGETLALANPFIVIATQNPIEYEGTFPLPEAQLDRFIIKLSIGYPNRAEEDEILKRRAERKKDVVALQAITSTETFLEMRATVEGVYVDPDVRRYIVELAAKSRSHRQVAVGVSPRGSLALLKLTRAWAAIQSRNYVVPDDIKQFMQPAFSHRIILDPSLWDVKKSENKIVAEIAQSVPVPVLNPKMTDKTRVAGLVLFSLLIAAVITRNGDIAWMMLPFLTYLGLGILQTSPAEKISLSAKRSLEQTRSDGIAAVGVHLTVQNTALEEVSCLIDETTQAGMKIMESDLPRWVTLQAGESAELSYTFSAVRGEFSWKSIKTVVSDPLNLIESELYLPADATIQVRPQTKKFKTIAFRPHNTVHSPGSIPARLGGNGTDFYGVREYHPGDPLRSLDWRLTARHPHKFFTKEYEQEEIADIGLILDARQDADLRMGEESIFEACVGATASLAETFLHQGDRVSLLVFGESMHFAFPGFGKAQLHRITGCLSKARVDSESRSSSKLDFLPLRMFPNHALIITITSALTSTDFTFFQRLRAYGYQALVICPDGIEFANLALKKDPTSQMAIRATRIERLLMLRRIAQLKIPVIDWPARQPLFPMVRNALSRSRGQREL